jgi:hypothetical protein
MFGDGAFGRAQPLPHSPRTIIEVFMQEKGLEAKLQAVGFHAHVQTLRARKDLLDRCRRWSLIMQHKKTFLCQGAEADA